MSRSSSKKRKFEDDQAISTNYPGEDTYDPIREDLIRRRAKLETPRGQECPCLHAALPQHIREIIMSSEAIPLTALLRQYHSSLFNSNISHLMNLHTPSSVLLAPNISSPAEDQASIRALYDFHINNPEGLLYHGLITEQQRRQAQQQQSKAPESLTEKAKGKGVGGGDELPTTALSAPSKGAEPPTTGHLDIEVQEITPMAPDWAFGRVELTPSLPSSATSSSLPPPPRPPQPSAAQPSREDENPLLSILTPATTREQPQLEPRHKIWAFLIFRKLSLGNDEEMRGWRIGRVCLIRAGDDVGGSDIPMEVEGQEVASAEVVSGLRPGSGVATAAGGGIGTQVPSVGVGRGGQAPGSGKKARSGGRGRGA